MIACLGGLCPDGFDIASFPQKILMTCFYLLNSFTAAASQTSFIHYLDSPLKQLKQVFFFSKYFLNSSSLDRSWLSVTAMVHLLASVADADLDVSFCSHPRFFRVLGLGKKVAAEAVFEGSEAVSLGAISTGLNFAGGWLVAFVHVCRNLVEGIISEPFMRKFGISSSLVTPNQAAKLC